MDKQSRNRMGVAAIASLGFTALAASAIIACISRDETRSHAQPTPPRPEATDGFQPFPSPEARPTREDASQLPDEAPSRDAPSKVKGDKEGGNTEGEQAEVETSRKEPVEPLPALVAISTDQIPANLGLDRQLWAVGSDRASLLRAIDHSLNYINTEKALQDYADYPIEGITRDRVRLSLQRFRELVQSARSAKALQNSVLKEFEVYQSTGQTGKNDAHFTGYFEPTYTASAVRTSEYRYPLFAAPADLESWPMPHPDRLALEGQDGLQFEQGPLQGLELVWLSSRLEAFLVQVQGSAKLSLADGSTMSVGYAGRTNYPYVSVGRELVNDGKFTLEELTLPLMLDFFRKNPQTLDDYLPRNPRFVFFKETGGAPPTGSLSVPVVAERSIATDKSLLPPGALAVVATQLPYADGQGGYVKHSITQFVLDQDTGGAIKGAGRADLFMGTGVEAGERAGLMNESGQLYYLMLKDGF